MDSPTWTIQSILNWTFQHFKEKQIASPRLDAELLLAEVLNYSRIELYLHHDQPLSEEEKASFRELVKKKEDRVFPSRIYWEAKVSGLWI